MKKEIKEKRITGTMEKTSPIQEEFFNRLSEILEAEFPKKQCKERSHALVLNAYANIYLREALKKENERIWKIVKKWKIPLKKTK